MEQEQSYHYNTVARAIAYIRENFREQPTLEEIAESVHMSPFHFQRVFTDWVGTSPKNFLQYVTLGYAKSLLNKQHTLFDTAFDSGLSGTSRLHDLFVKIEGMTPAEYQNEGNKLNINYSFSETVFGTVIVASTAKGICHLMFCEDQSVALEDLKSRFPKAQFTGKQDELQKQALAFFDQKNDDLPQLKLHLKGTDFQLKVWSALLKIPFGDLTTYGELAKQINQPSASRAVGTAIGSNPIAFLIPCHRVIQQSGAIGGYMWGPTRKSVIIGWEGVKTNEVVI